MSPRGIVAVALLVPALMLERSAYYGSRSFLFLFAQRLHVTTAEISTMAAATMWVATLSGFVGGAIAIAAGPRLTAAIGAFLSALGLFALAADIQPAFYLVALGGGVFRTCLWASLADVVLRDYNTPGIALPANRFAILTGISTLAYGALNFSAMIAPPIAGRITQSASIGAACTTCGVADVVAALLVGGAVLAARSSSAAKTDAASPAGPYRTPGAPAPGSAVTQGLLGLAIVIAALCVSSAEGEIEFPSDAGVGTATLYAINPGTIVVCTFFVCALWLAASIDRWSLSPLGIAGAGIAIGGLGVTLYAIGGGFVAYALGAFLGGVGEILSNPAFYAFIALSVPRKYAALAIAAATFATLLTSTILRPIMAIEAARLPMTVLVALVTIGAGIGLALFARKIHRAYFDPQPTV